jgi:hypothetical protein
MQIGQKHKVACHFAGEYGQQPTRPVTAELLGVVYMLQRLRTGLHRWTSGKQIPELSERDAEASAPKLARNSV